MHTMLSFQLEVLVALWLLVATGEASLGFINPSPAGANKDYTANPIYTEGDSITLQWSGSVIGVPVTLVMLQQTLEGEGDASQEVIVDSSISGLTKYAWTIATNKNLTASNVFFLALFANQSTTPDATSHYFNITAKDATTTTTSSSTTLTTTTSSIALSTSAASVSSTTTTTSVVSSATSAAVSSGLSTGASIGIGVGIGIPVSLAIGALATWCFFKHRAKTSGATAKAGTDGYGDYENTRPSGGHSRVGSYPVLSDDGHTQSGGSVYSSQEVPGNRPQPMQQHLYNSNDQHFPTHYKDYGTSNVEMPAQLESHHVQQLDGHNLQRRPEQVAQLDHITTAVPGPRYELL